jgi:hypothetical protein
LVVGAATTSGTPAYFTTKANYSDITDPLNPITGPGNLDLTINMNDVSKGGQGDEISILLMDGSTVLYSSNWNGTKTILQPIDGGNVSVLNSSAPTSSMSPNLVTVEMGTEKKTVEVLADKLTVTAFPNPAKSQFNLKLVSNNTTDAISVRVMNQIGQIMEVRNNLTSGQTIQFGAAYRHGAYFAEVIQGSNRKVVQLLKQAD